MLNKEHPDYPKFKAEWDAMSEKYAKAFKEASEEMSATGYRGKDGLSSKIVREQNTEIKKLKEKYSYLYE